MADYIKLPFLETKISLFDLCNLEKKGYLRSIFIQLLKADKIRNIIPNELEIRKTAEEFLLKYDIKELKSKKFEFFC